MQLLPTEIIYWVHPKYFNLKNYLNDSPIGCFFEDDSDYLDKLNDLHNDYPLAEEKIEVTEKMLSKYQL